MNSAVFRAVKGIAGPWLPVLSPVFVSLCAVSATSCVDVDGGAIELSWTLRTFEGEVISSDQEEACRRAGIESIRVCWRPAGAGGVDAGAPECAGGRSRTFACGDDRGVTRFEVEPGEQAIWLEPVCEGGEMAVEGTYQVPAPIVRGVAEGAVVALGAQLVEATDGARNCPAAGCTCDF